MKLSLSELRALQAIAQGVDTPKEITKTIKRSYSQTSKVLKKLEEKSIVRDVRDRISIVRHQHIALLVQELSEHENLPEILSNSGIPILQTLTDRLSAQEIADKTGLSRQMVHRVLTQARNMSIVAKDGSRYTLNGSLWPKLKEFICTLNTYEDTIDERLPADAIIYRKDAEHILFSSKQTVDAAPAAFSAFERFDMNVRLTTNYYIIGSAQLSARAVLQQCLWVLESRPSIQLIIFTAIFSEKTGVHVRHPIMRSIQSVLAGRDIDNYPSRDEIAQRAESYGVRLR